MTWFIPSEIAQLSMDVILSLVFLYLYLNDRKSYILVWSIGWGVWSLKYFFEILLYLGNPTKFLEIATLLCWLFGSFLLAYGTFIFINKKIPKYFSLGTLITSIWILISIVFNMDPIIYTIPIFMFPGTMYIWTGIVLLKLNKSHIPGKYITVWAFLLGGIHLADYPILSRYPVFAPWGYLIAAILSFIIGNSLMVAYYQKIRKDLSDSESRFRLLAENAQDMIFRYSLDNNPRMEYISPAVEKITGYPIGEFLINPDLYFNIIELDEEIPDSLSKKELFIMQNELLMKLTKKDGSTIWIEQHSTPIFDKKGNIIAIEGISRDITERKTAEDEIIRLDKSRRSLLSNISHELKTPITSIQGYIEALLDNVITESEDIEFYLKLIHSRTLGLNRIIRDLFELARLESRHISFNFQPFFLTELLNQIHNKYKTDINHAGINCIIEETYSDSSRISIDMDRIDQVFTNIISNGIRYTPKNGTITISHRIIKEENKLLFKISDTGSGIENEHIPHIFDRFYKASKSRESSRGNSGLGLAITKEIVEAHKGDIWIESIPGKGSTFCFTIPLLSDTTKKLVANDFN